MKNFARLLSPTLKNDKVDAKLVALYMASDLKTVNPIRMDELKDLSRLYYKTVKQFTRYKMMFKDQVNIIFPELDKHICLKSTTGIPYLLLKYPTPRLIAHATVQELRTAMTKHLVKSSVFTVDYVKKIQCLAMQSVGIDAYPVSMFQHTIKIMLFYKKLVAEIKKNMQECLMKTAYYPLLDNWGYNICSLATIVGEVGDIRRFSNYRKFVSYCGFSISEHTSGTSLNKKSRITKKGNSILRTTFFMLVLNHLRYKREFYGFYTRLKQHGKHPKKCVVAVARKLAVKCYFDMLHCHD